jgi:hypothetical protein
VGKRAVRLIREAIVLVALAALLLAGHVALERDASAAPARPACQEVYEDGAPTGTCWNWPDNPVPMPTSSYDGRAPYWEADRRPIEQNPTCWITNPGWPRCSERTDTP